MLHYWYIGEHYIDQKLYHVAHGIVTGHKRLNDSISMHTSAIRAVHIDKDTDEALITTQNSVYHCPLSYCRFEKQDEYPDLLPDYERLKAQYKNTIPYPSIEPGKVLLVIADFCSYYFHSLYFVPEDSTDGEKVEYCSYPHVGTFQDSYLIFSKGGYVDLSYFPHFQNIEFYVESTKDHPLFVENIGTSTLFVKAFEGTIRLDPGERKEISKDNAEPEKIFLPGGDLYPAGIIE
ncbi:MAG: hypothetical protein IKI75_11265 [Lachnospiraceae bacterium]|nr:hypothetical protein [Lachnospiraceae bacterium]